MKLFEEDVAPLGVFSPFQQTTRMLKYEMLEDVTRGRRFKRILCLLKRISPT